MSSMAQARTTTWDVKFQKGISRSKMEVSCHLIRDFMGTWIRLLLVRNSRECLGKACETFVLFAIFYFSDLHFFTEPCIGSGKPCKTSHKTCDLMQPLRISSNFRKQFRKTVNIAPEWHVIFPWTQGALIIFFTKNLYRCSFDNTYSQPLMIESAKCL